MFAMNATYHALHANKTKITVLLVQMELICMSKNVIHSVYNRSSSMKQIIPV